MANKNFKSYLSEIFGVDDAVIAGAAALGGYAAGKNNQPDTPQPQQPSAPTTPAGAYKGHNGGDAAFANLNPIEQAQLDNLYYKFKAIPDKSDWPPGLNTAMQRYEQMLDYTNHQPSGAGTMQLNETVPDQYDVYRFEFLVNKSYDDTMHGRNQGTLHDRVKADLLNQLSKLVAQYKQQTSKPNPAAPKPSANSNTQGSEPATSPAAQTNTPAQQPNSTPNTSATPGNIQRGMGPAQTRNESDELARLKELLK